MYQHSIKLKAGSDLEALRKLAAITTIAENITTDNLELLAEKSKKAGVNVKIQTFKNFI